MLNFAFLGLGTAAVYALLALGVVLIYRGSGVLNFGHGAFAMAGAYASYEVSGSGHHFWAGLAAAVAVGAGLGVLVSLLVMRPMAAASPLTKVVATLAVLAVVEAVATLRYSGVTIFTNSPFPTGLVHWGSIRFPQDRLWLTGVALIITAMLWWGTRATRFGVAMSAAAEDEVGVAALGWSPTLIATATWAMGGALGAVAGVLDVPLTSLQVTNFPLLVIPAMAAGLLGRFWSFPLTMLGAIGIGVIQSILSDKFSAAGWPQVVPLLAIIVLLLIRGRGVPTRGQIGGRLPAIGPGVLRHRALAISLALLCALSLIVFDDNLNSAVTVTFAVALIVLSVVVLTGFTGQLSLAQAVIAGVGALIAGHLVVDLDWPYELAFLGGAAATTVLGLLFALPALRTRGTDLAVITLSLGLAVQMVVFSSASYTGGIAGLDVGAVHILGLNLDPVTHSGRYAVFAILVFTLGILSVSNVRRGRMGKRMIALRGNERAAASLGISLGETKAYAFALAAFVASLGGILLAFTNHIVDFSNFDTLTSINVVIFAVVGGVGYMAGSVFGATLASGSIGSLILDELSLGQAWLSLIGGVGLLIILIQGPDGAVPNLARDIRRVSRLAQRAVRGRRGRRQAGAEAAAAIELPPTSARTQVPKALLTLRRLTVRYGNVTGVDSVSFEVRSGEITGLIGANGAGKTSLIDAITGFAKLSSGSVQLNGHDVSRLHPHRRARLGISRSFQSLELFDDLTVRENLVAASDDHLRRHYLTDLLWSSSPTLSSSGLAAVQEFGLADVLDRRPSELSNGRRRLVSIARAIAAEPSVLLLDEPAAGLDEHESAELGHLLTRLAREWGFAVLLVEHDVSLVMDVCNSVVVLDFGKKIAEGEPGLVRADPAVVAAYLGADFDLASVGAERAQ